LKVERPEISFRLPASIGPGVAARRTGFRLLFNVNESLVPS